MAELNLRSGVAYQPYGIAMDTTITDVSTICNELTNDAKEIKEQIKTLDRKIKIAKKRSWLNKKNKE